MKTITTNQIKIQKWKTKQCAMRTQHKSVQKKIHKSATGQQKSIPQCYLYSCFPGQMGGG